MSGPITTLDLGRQSLLPDVATCGLPSHRVEHRRVHLRRPKVCRLRSIARRACNRTRLAATARNSYSPDGGPAAGRGIERLRTGQLGCHAQPCSCPVVPQCTRHTHCGQHQTVQRAGSEPGARPGRPIPEQRLLRSLHPRPRLCNPRTTLYREQSSKSRFVRESRSVAAFERFR